MYFKRFREKPALLASFFDALERLTYFLLVTKVGINERIETYADLTKEIEPEVFDGSLVGLKTLDLGGLEAEGAAQGGRRGGPNSGKRDVTIVERCSPFPASPNPRAFLNFFWTY